MGLGLGILPAIHRHLDPIINTYVRYPVLYKRQVRLMNKIRKKDNISVLFVLTSLASWKTEDLYKVMKSNGRFSTDILITVAYDEDARPSLRQYLTSKGYSYFELHEVDIMEEWFSQAIQSVLQKPSMVILMTKMRSSHKVKIHIRWFSLSSQKVCLHHLRSYTKTCCHNFL